MPRGGHPADFASRCTNRSGYGATRSNCSQSYACIGLYLYFSVVATLGATQGAKLCSLGFQVFGCGLTATETKASPDQRVTSALALAKAGHKANVVDVSYAQRVASLVARLEPTKRPSRWPSCSLQSGRIVGVSSATPLAGWPERVPAEEWNVEVHTLKLPK